MEQTMHILRESTKQTFCGMGSQETKDSTTWPIYSFNSNPQNKGWCKNCIKIYRSKISKL
jgi:hypothetical protein